MSAGAIAGSQVSQLGSSVNKFAELSSEDFVRIMITELTNQDPLEPNDSQALLDQMSSLRDIEGQLTLEAKLEELVSQSVDSNNAQLIAQAGAMIGKVVTGVGTEGDFLQGEVTSVRLRDGQVTLELDTGKSMLLNGVSQISDRSADS